MKVLLGLLAAVALVATATPPANAAVYHYGGHTYHYRHHGHYYRYHHNGHYYNHRTCYVSHGRTVCTYR